MARTFRLQRLGWGSIPLKAVVGMIEQAKKGAPKASTTINRDSLMKMIAQVSAMAGRSRCS